MRNASTKGKIASSYIAARRITKPKLINRGARSGPISYALILTAKSNKWFLSRIGKLISSRSNGSLIIKILEVLQRKT